MNPDSRPLIIPIFLPHAGCPHRCVFCDQAAITGTGQRIPTPEELRVRIQTFLKYTKNQRKEIQIAFFGGNFLGLSNAEIGSLLGESASLIRAGLADGIRFSTRPDTIDHPRLDLIRKFPVATIELGVQSMDDHVLALSGRGHSRADSIGAVQLLKANNYEVGVQLMVGLPGDTPAVALETARQVRDLKPDFVRIYPTVVLAGSLLARWYQNGRYIPLSLEDAVHQVKDLYLLFKNSGIRIIRMGLQASKDLENGSSILAGPYHPAFGHLVYSEIFLTAVQSVLTRAQFSKDRISIRVHPVSVSKMRGLNNSNLDKLKRAFGLKSVAIGADSALANDLVRLNDDPPFSIYPNYRIFPA